MPQGQSHDCFRPKVVGIHMSCNNSNYVHRFMHPRQSLHCIARSWCWDRTYSNPHLNFLQRHSYMGTLAPPMQNVQFGENSENLFRYMQNCIFRFTTQLEDVNIKRVRGQSIQEKWHLMKLCGENLLP